MPAAVGVLPKPCRAARTSAAANPAVAGPATSPTESPLARRWWQSSPASRPHTHNQNGSPISPCSQPPWAAHLPADGGKVAQLPGRRVAADAQPHQQRQQVGGHHQDHGAWVRVWGWMRGRPEIDDAGMGGSRQQVRGGHKDDGAWAKVRVERRRVPCRARGWPPSAAPAASLCARGPMRLLPPLLDKKNSPPWRTHPSRPPVPARLPRSAPPARPPASHPPARAGRCARGPAPPPPASTRCPSS